MIVFDTPFTFRNFLGEGKLLDFVFRGGGDCKIFRHEALECGKERTVLENFDDFQKIYFLKLKIIKNMVYLLL